MKRLSVVVLVLAMLAASCSAIKENVDVDVDGLASAACNTIADTFAAAIVRQMEQISVDPSFPVPDVDVSSMLASASGLGCSPSQMRALIEDKAESARVDADRAKDFLDSILNAVDEG